MSLRLKVISGVGLVTIGVVAGFAAALLVPRSVIAD
jgi:hypothetical protein